MISLPWRLLGGGGRIPRMKPIVGGSPGRVKGRRIGRGAAELCAKLRVGRSSLEGQNSVDFMGFN